MVNENLKGIILAGGKATRLRPATEVISKQLLPVYDKPMIYYPLSTLMLAGIRDVLVISTPDDVPQFVKLLGDGSSIGMNFKYANQNTPRGLADAFIVGEEFIGEDRTCLVLGDNIFHSHGLTEILYDAAKKVSGATIFGNHVRDPERYGIVEFDRMGKVISIEEKPEKPKSQYAVVGLYFYDNDVIEISKSLKPSERGEIEITDVNRKYLERGDLEVKLFGRGFMWLDTGTSDSLSDAAEYVRIVQRNSNSMVGCIEEVAYRQGFIDIQKLDEIASSEKLINSDYGKYLKRIVQEEAA